MPDYNEFLSKHEDMISYSCLGSSENPPVVLIHGFLGDKSDWQEILSKLPDSFFYIAIDLPGHGESAAPIPTLTQLAQSLNNLLKQLTNQPCILIGYSMGGRVALHFAERHPDSIKAIGLLSASLGIQDEHEKSTRYASDLALANEIEKRSMKKFIETWYRLPLFGNLRHHDHFPAFLEKRLSNSPQAVAQALRQFSVANHGYFGHLIKTFPSLYIAGELDEKYVQVCHDIQQLNPHAGCHVVPDCGHAVHIETPNTVGKLMRDFLTSFLDQCKTEANAQLL